MSNPMPLLAIMNRGGIPQELEDKWRNEFTPPEGRYNSEMEFVGVAMLKMICMLEATEADLQKAKKVCLATIAQRDILADQLVDEGSWLEGHDKPTREDWIKWARDEWANGSSVDAALEYVNLRRGVS